MSSCVYREGENPPIYSRAGRLKQRVERRKIRLIEGNAKCSHVYTERERTLQFIRELED